MPVVQLADVIQPEFFSQYMAGNSMVSAALFRSGVLVPNALMESQISAGGDRSKLTAPSAVRASN
jgi:hypothetical protein